jgi:dTDP-4-dehydrorhamnose 3,5-epimerase
MIVDVVVTPLAEYADERGSTLHMLRAAGAGFSRFGECYFSEIVPGAIKAWKRHGLQTQNIAVPVGRISLVIYDDREASATRGELEVRELGRPDCYLRLQIPPGVWYGFECISDSSALLVNCTDVPHDPSDSESRPWTDPSIPNDWPAASGRTLDA